MPITHEGYCAFCGKYFKGFKKQYCSWQCRVAKTGKAQSEILRQSNILYKPENFDTGELDVMYNKQKMTYAEIGLAFGGLARNTIKKILIAKGFKLRKLGELASIRLRGYVRDKEFIQKHLDWFKTHKHPKLGKSAKPESIAKAKETRMNGDRYAWTEEQKRKKSEYWHKVLKYDPEYLKRLGKAWEIGRAHV